MIILDGKKIKEDLSLDLKDEIEKLSSGDAVLPSGAILPNNVALPKLVILQVGDNASSNIYIKQKLAFAEKIGALAELVKFDENVESTEIIEKIKNFNLDETVHGIILQLPIPENLNQTELLDCIDPAKDVDGLGAVNISKLVRNDKSGTTPATARGIIKLLEKYDMEIAGKNVVVVGRSVLVGKSMSLALINLNATVTICHSQTKNLAEYTKQADIIISAVGQPGIINDECVNENQIIIDVGISRDGEGLIAGDVKLEKATVAAISPVPGGVGQMTVLSLFQNLLDSYKKQKGV